MIIARPGLINALNRQTSGLPVILGLPAACGKVISVCRTALTAWSFPKRMSRDYACRCSG